MILYILFALLSTIGTIGAILAAGIIAARILTYFTEEL